MTKQEKIINLAIVIIAPFIVTSSIEFLPWWLSAPISFVTFLFWLGTMKQITEYVAEEKP